MKLCAKTLQHLRCKLGIEWINLARFPRGQVDNEKGDNRHKEQCDYLLDYAAADK